MLALEIASLLGSLLLFYYTYRFYSIMSDTKLQDALRLLLNGFLLLVLQAIVGIAQDMGWLVISFPKGDLDELLSLIAYIIIIAAMVRLRRVFVQFEVQKRAIKMLRNVFE
ncbi:MAG: hypothetical protein ABH863_01485 [Candidatus Micrarchaeota archaeon]